MKPFTMDGYTDLDNLFAALKDDYLSPGWTMMTPTDVRSLLAAALKELVSAIPSRGNRHRDEEAMDLFCVVHGIISCAEEDGLI
jgi:hypothetical protein